MRRVSSESLLLIQALKESCTIPAATILAVWDYKRGKMRRIRDDHNRLTTWEYGRTDEIATEHGYEDGESFVDAVRDQVATYERIRELRGIV